LRFFAGYLPFTGYIYTEFNPFLIIALIRNAHNPGLLRIFRFDAPLSRSLYCKLPSPPFLSIAVKM